MKLLKAMGKGCLTVVLVFALVALALLAIVVGHEFFLRYLSEDFAAAAAFLLFIGGLIFAGATLIAYDTGN